jgi:dTDP-glucose 4,6-dehydratase
MHSLFGGSGFILSNYSRLYPTETFIEKRDAVTPTYDDVIYGISTTHNYHPINGDLNVDIDTNLKHLVKILPNVNGEFTFLSSWFIYAGGRQTTAEQGAMEEETGRPIGFYSASKLCAELLVESYCKSMNKEYRILRLCNVIGGDSAANSKKNALEFMLKKLSAGEPVDIYKGNNYRDYLHVDDVCAAIKLVVERGHKNDIYNIGSGKSARIVDIVNHAKAYLNSSSEVNIIEPPSFHKIVQTKDFFMNCDKLKSLGFVPKYSVFDAVDSIITK